MNDLAPTTLKVRPLLVPPLVITVTVRAPTAAFDAIVKEVVKDVAEVMFVAPTVTPLPLTKTVVPLLTKLAPIKVTVTVESVVPDEGVIELNVGNEATGAAPTTTLTVASR